LASFSADILGQGTSVSFGCGIIANCKSSSLKRRRFRFDILTPRDFRARLVE